jgi:hypothetical protein
MICDYDFSCVCVRNLIFWFSVKLKVLRGIGEMRIVCCGSDGKVWLNEVLPEGDKVARVIAENGGVDGCGLAVNSGSPNNIVLIDRDGCVWEIDLRSNRTTCILGVGFVFRMF